MRIGPNLAFEHLANTFPECLDRVALAENTLGSGAKRLQNHLNLRVVQEYDSAQIGMHASQSSKQFKAATRLPLEIGADKEDIGIAGVKICLETIRIGRQRGDLQAFVTLQSVC